LRKTACFPRDVEHLLSAYQTTQVRTIEFLTITESFTRAYHLRSPSSSHKNENAKTISHLIETTTTMKLSLLIRHLYTLTVKSTIPASEAQTPTSDTLLTPSLLSAPALPESAKIALAVGVPVFVLGLVGCIFGFGGGSEEGEGEGERRGVEVGG
jgi:hypothetical protein